MQASVGLTLFLFSVSQGGDPGGALGLFRQYDSEDDQDGMIPMQIPTSRAVAQAQAQDTHSDVPSDELQDMMTSSQDEQDLSGFDKARDIQKVLGQFGSPGSFDNEDGLKERKRIKRAARKHRAGRKQPPVTMEI
jgi:hypothetical protein